jgi:hypothetical protein
MQVLLPTVLQYFVLREQLLVLHTMSQAANCYQAYRGAATRTAAGSEPLPPMSELQPSIFGISGLNSQQQGLSQIIPLPLLDVTT